MSRPVRGERYGQDAPSVVVSMLGAGVGGGAITAALVQSRPRLAALVGALAAVPLALGASMVAYNRAGKLALRDRIIDSLELTGRERVLDVGTGRGLLAVAAARRLPDGAVVGVDIWRPGDLSGNGRNAARANADAAGVAVDLVEGDVRALPFPDDHFDAVVSLLCLANVSPRADREAAVAECLRVLRPGGQLVLADYRLTRQYTATLQRLGQPAERTGALVPFWQGPMRAARLRKR